MLLPKGPFDCVAAGSRGASSVPVLSSPAAGLEPLLLEQALAAEPECLRTAEESLRRGECHKSHKEHSYVARSCYELQLQRYQQLFPRDQI